MSRPKQCSSCLYFIPATEISRDILDIISTLYDGWCKHYGEERDRDEETCEHYAKQVNRRKK
jgi:hypothetical protein